MTRRNLARRMAACCRQLSERGITAGQYGNVSVRVRGRRNPTSELDLHLRILRRRRDVEAVVYAHPPTATAFAVAGAGFTSFVLPELIFRVGPVPLVPFGTPGTPEMGDRVEPFLADHEAMLLANHGAVTLGRTLDEAWIGMETLEHAARILFGARVLGRITALDPGAVAQLEALRARSQREWDV